MERHKLESLLRQAVMEGPRDPLSPECLGVSAILALLDGGEGARREDVRHLADCGYCQWALALAKHERDLLEAPWKEEPENDAPDNEDVRIAEEGGPVSRLRTIKLSHRLAALSVVTGIAAVLVVAITIGLWSPNGPDLIGSVTGQLAAASGTRDRGKPEKQYRLSIELKRAAYLTFFYLDSGLRRELKLPADATEQAKEFAAGAHPDIFYVIVTDDPPGYQWIAAVASEQPFNPVALRDELQTTVAALPDHTRFDDIVDRLEDELRGRRRLSFRGHRFEVPGAPGS